MKLSARQRIRLLWAYPVFAIRTNGHRAARLQRPDAIDAFREEIKRRRLALAKEAAEIDAVEQDFEHERFEVFRQRLREKHGR